MSKVLVTETHLEDIAAAIRRKLGVATLYRPGEMAAAIRSIETYPEPAGEISITQNGQANVKDYATANVSVPNTYAAADEGKVVSGGALIAQTARAQAITANGTYDTTENSSVTVSVEGGSQGITGFELHGATFDGNTQSFKGVLDNQYIACCFHDNMSATYTLNGVSETFTASASGYSSGRIYGVTKAVSDNGEGGVNAIINRGSLFTSSHYDSGSYMSVVGGWVGVPSGGTVYENAVSNAATNTITMNAAHGRLLIFLAGSNSGMGAVTTVDINGVTYNVTNMGTRYDSVYSLYTAIVIDNNAATTITLTFPVACHNYMSIIGLD